MKSKYLLLCISLLTVWGTKSVAQTHQTADSLYCAHFYSDEMRAYFYLNPTEPNIIVPGYEFIGPTNGFLRGESSSNLYGVWFVLSAKREHGHLRLRLSNDTGADSQTVEFKYEPDGSYTWNSTGTNRLTRAENRKLVKIGTHYKFRRID